MGFGLPGEIDQPRDQFVHHPCAAHGLEARMQRGQLDRDAGPVGQGTVTGRASDRLDRAGIGVEIAGGIIGRARAFAEHVERVALMARGMRLRARQRGFNSLAEHEMVAHQPHRLPRRRAHGRRAQPFGEPSDGPLRSLAGLDHAGRHAKRPGRSVDQERARSRFVVDEVALAELVLDELVGGAGVRHPQQRFRQHHQRQSFLGRQREFAQHVLDAAERIVIGPDRLDQPRRRAVDAGLLRPIQPHGPEQAVGHRAIIGRVGRAEGRNRRL